MGLQERLMDEMKDAMRRGDISRRDTLRMVRAAVKNAEIDLRREATDQEIEDIIRREVKRRQEAIEMFRQGNRQDLIAQEEEQLAVLQEYLPEQLSRDAIQEVVEQVVSELGATGPAQMGPVMREVMARLKGRADGRLTNEIVREVLARSR
ncbi:MAG TPA: GatB/YqeY domain-containing protein [Chloroflexi bacterium]|jgi:uncharacterized protein YqeY|nr:GatB/YqeY domain-containing protein [Chloroflexota bacterium]